ncbi:hypothetical protein [Pseudodesulfovibrio sediminis]|uniref:Uncharacterized protein n=1 Tax=Pseudodesulfovibrio sediminis TaxID=2810563 RepID=A0ABM7P3E4_9BACT|nr:hypothetical protein [Pseudodesulfovibrio sediminis]BCS87372.1 hypothetical protein PSDVSF_06140 [Pseudodesulfovibrio sediminis]
MKNSRIALILIACAALLAVGAYVLFQKQAPSGPMLRAEAVQPPDTPAKAPDWVNGGQKTQPDYTPSTTAPEAPKETLETQPVKEVKPLEIAEDKVVSFTFVESLTEFMLDRFQPQGPHGKPATLISSIALNRYFGRELEGFNTEGDDINASRKSVLDYAFNPTMIKTLYDLYASAFMIHLVDTASTDEREYVVGKKEEIRTLTNEEIQVMLKLNSRRIERTADLFRTMGSSPEFIEMTSKYRRLAQAVGRANSQLQDTIADGKNSTNASKRFQQAILQREQAKTALVTYLKQVCQSCSDTELFYLSQWAYRRYQNGPENIADSFVAAADIMDDLAARFRAQADEIK